MPYGVFVPLRKATRERLLELARVDRRMARDQAAVILERAITEAAVAPAEAPRRAAPESEPVLT